MWSLPSLGDPESTNNYDYIEPSTGPTDGEVHAINNQYSIGYEGDDDEGDGGWWWERDVGTEPHLNLGSRTNGNLSIMVVIGLY